MENRERVENSKYHMSSHWIKNRSKFLTFLTISHGGFENGRYISHLGSYPL